MTTATLRGFTVAGAFVNATAYSIVETAKANKVNVRIYLQYIIENMSARKANNGSFDDEFLEKMMPWSLEYREYEKSFVTNNVDRFRMLFPEPVKPKTPPKCVDKDDVDKESPPAEVA